MWTRENRSLYEHKSARYSSDLSDAEWALTAKATVMSGLPAEA